MIYKNIVKAKFIKRINRFIAKVEIQDQIEEVHVKNTGRCQELFIEGRTVFLEPAQNPNRKTKYSLIAIYKDDKLINIDSQVPNQVVYESLMNNQIPDIQDITYLKREKTYGKSRFDIYYENKAQKGFIEVKGVTLENNGIACFPDSPTTRGKKHLEELIQGQKEGYQNYIFLLIQMQEVSSFVPNHKTDPDFAKTLIQAEKEGVKILCYNATITNNSIQLKEKIAYHLE